MTLHVCHAKVHEMATGPSSISALDPLFSTSGFLCFWEQVWASVSLSTTEPLRCSFFWPDAQTLPFCLPKVLESHPLDVTFPHFWPHWSWEISLLLDAKDKQMGFSCLKVFYFVVFFSSTNHSGDRHSRQSPVQSLGNLTLFVLPLSFPTGAWQIGQTKVVVRPRFKSWSSHLPPVILKQISYLPHLPPGVVGTRDHTDTKPYLVPGMQ